MNWLQKIAQQNRNKAEEYFSIGHGDYDEETGLEPNYIVWAYINGKIEHGSEGYGEGVIQESDEDLPHGGTHGSIWGHDVTNNTYKGRYEPQTGRVSIVKPEGKEFYNIPNFVLQALHNTFSHITKVIEF